MNLKSRLLSGFRTSLAVVMLVSVLVSGCSNSPTPEDQATPTPIPTPIIPTKPTYTVQVGEVVKKLNFSGRIVPVVQEELFFKTSGRIDKVLVKRGEAVTAGQLLAELEIGNREFDVRRAELNVEISRMDLEMAKKETPWWSDTYTLTIGIREKQYELAQLSLEELQTSISDARIVSPLKGIILDLTMTEGTNAEPYKPVIVVADTSTLEVSADVMSTDMQTLAEGMAVITSPVGRPGETMDGTIRRLPYPYGSASQKASATDKSTRISLATDPAQLGFGIGDLVNVTVLLEKKENALWLPPQAIRKFEGRRFVVVKEGEGQRRIDVKIGIEGEDRVEILEGLTEGQLVLSP